MHFPTALTRQKSSDSLGPRKTTPWIASPLAQRATGQNAGSEETESHATERVVEFNESQHELHNSHPGVEEPVFREHHESSTVELFFDLFFVANLATFTANHEIVDVSSLKNYLGFFTLLWFTWLQYSLFDVRFSTDSVFNRMCKAVSFGVMTGFAVCGALYDQTNVEENAKAFRAMSLILMVSRLALIGQYGVVLFYVRRYKNTVWPLALTMLALFVGAMVYLGTFFGFSAGSEDSFPIEHGGPKTYAAW
jgi:Bacterial low temperature requirement A protein (LtrA)